MSLDQRQLSCLAHRNCGTETSRHDESESLGSKGPQLGVRLRRGEETEEESTLDPTYAWEASGQVVHEEMS